MFAWNTYGKLFFRDLIYDFETTQPIAANLGIHNGFLSFGIMWSLTISHEPWDTYAGLIFLGGIALTSLLAAMTISKKIFYVQGIPGLIAAALEVYVRWYAN